MGWRKFATRPTKSLAAGVFLFGLATGAQADMLRATYGVSLLGLPIGVANVTANLTSSSYSIEARAKLSGLATLVSHSRGASTGAGAIVAGHVAPASYATTASNDKMTRTIRMSLASNAVTGVDIAPPFDEKPDRVPLGERDKQGILDPVGAFVLPAPAGAPPTSAAACSRTMPVFDGYTRFDIALSYVGQREVKTKGYSGPVAICAVRYIPIAGYQKDRPATKFMAENKDIEVWLAPVGGVGVLIPFRVSVRTMVGTAVLEATEFAVVDK